jgi:hypothetical protein
MMDLQKNLLTFPVLPNFAHGVKLWLRQKKKKDILESEVRRLNFAAQDVR